MMPLDITESLQIELNQEMNLHILNAQASQSNTDIDGAP